MALSRTGSALLTLVAMATACAHPGNGIVANADGSVITGDPAGSGIWLFRQGQAPRLLTGDFHCHWLTRGLDGHLYAEQQGTVGGQWTATHFRLSDSGQGPTRLWRGGLENAIFAVDRQGRFVIARDGALQVRRSDGAFEPFRGNGRVVTGEPALGQVAAFAWGPEDTLYLVDGPNLRRVGRDGAVRLVKALAEPATNGIYAGPRNSPKIWGLAVDDAGRAYLAASSHGTVIRVDPNGSSTEVAREDDGWIATGVTVREGAIYLLEGKLDGNRNLGPRVRVLHPGQPPVVIGTLAGR